MKAHLLVFIVGVLHALQINGLETKSEQILEAKIRRLESRLTDLEAKVDLCSDKNGKLTSQPERAAMEKRIESLESDVLDWKNQVNLLQITVDTLAQQCNATEEKVSALSAKNPFSGTLLNSTQQEIGNVTITVGQLASEHEDIKKEGNDTLEATYGLLTTASNATQQEVPVGRCNVLFPNEPDRFPEVRLQIGHRWTTLHAAAENPNVDKVCELLEKGADPNQEDFQGKTPLHWAAESNSNADVIRVLIEQGADPSLKDDGGNTPLHSAVNSNSKFDALLAFLEKGADPNLKDERGLTLLHRAARFNKNVDVIRGLLEKGADHSLTDEDGNTALHWAATANSNIHVMISLLEKGADHSLMNNDGDTPLSVASTKNKKSVLMKYGART